LPSERTRLRNWYKALLQNPDCSVAAGLASLWLVYVAGEGVWLNYERDRYSRAPVNQSELTGAMEDRREPPAGGGGGGGRPGND